jgi:hypothetical protein
MKNPFSTLLIICLVCISTTQGCLTLYQSYYGQPGDQLAMCTSGNLPTAWNDQVSSIVVPPGWRATLYKNYNNGGEALNISEGIWNASSAWNDQVSSIQIYPGCPVFYSDYGFNGTSFVMCKSGNVSADFNDDVSSIYVPSRWKLTLYQDYNYHGPQLNVNSGSWNASSSWNDKLSSVKVSGGCPVFYSDFRLSGTSFVACSGGDVPADFNDDISSILVPSGWKLTLYQDYGYRGASLSIGSGTWTASNSWNDKLSSFKVTSHP